MIPTLKELATQKYEAILEDEWNSESFSESLLLMFDETPDTDRMLKDVAIKCAGEKSRELADRGEFAALFKERGEIGFEIFKASFNIPPVFVTTKGSCPWFGLHHSSSVETGRTFKYWCTKCRKGFE